MPPSSLAIVAFFLVASFVAGAVGGIAALLVLRARERRPVRLRRTTIQPGSVIRAGDELVVSSAGVVTRIERIEPTREAIDEEHPAIRAFADMKPAKYATTPEREARLERSRRGETKRVSAAEMRARLEARERRLFADEDEIDLVGRNE